MSGDPASLLDAGQAAIRAGDWSVARDAFSAVLEREEHPAALYGLGEALFWQGESAGVVRLNERAHARSRREDPVQAAMAAINLYFLNQISLGKRAVSRGWLARLTRLVEEHEIESLRAWLVLLRSNEASERDPEAGERLAREALVMARAGGDLDLELCALSQVGAMVVAQGRVEEGLAMVDEAMAGSLGGEGTGLDTVVFTSCTAMLCCSRAAQLERAAQWIRATDEFVRRYGSPYLHTQCRLHYGLVLFWTGRWEKAERQIAEALEGARRGEPALVAEALATLAELRLAQGRIDEAAGLLDGVEDQPACGRVLGALHLARGEPALAASILARRLRAVGSDRLGAVGLVELLGEAEVALGAHR